MWRDDRVYDLGRQGFRVFGVLRAAAVVDPYLQPQKAQVLSMRELRAGSPESCEEFQRTALGFGGHCGVLNNYPILGFRSIIIAKWPQNPILITKAPIRSP